MSTRTCTRFYCDKVKARLCCADCSRRCDNRCLNSPEACGLLAAPEPPPTLGNKAGKRYRSFDPAQAQRLYDKGLTDSEIAERLGVSAGAITGWRHNEGLGPKRRGRT